VGSGHRNAPEFFRALSRAWPEEVIVVTYRRDRRQAVDDLVAHGIRYDDVVLVDAFERKAEVIAERGVGVYIDDQPEMLKNVPAGVSMLLFRNEENFDFDDRRWMLSAQTGTAWTRSTDSQRTMQRTV
jgi:hypothetical protein